jgi:xanthine dehydrogenase YagR molybdenum-binding subunit
VNDLLEPQSMATRRGFLKTTGAATVALASPTAMAQTKPETAPPQSEHVRLKAGLSSGIREAEGSVTPAELDDSYAHDAFGAYFAEVGVHRDTGEVRVRRMLGVFAAGRILNAMTARSQMIGAMIWGIGSAHEGKSRRPALWLLHQPGFGELPRSSERRCRRARRRFLDEADSHGSKGLGELGICGAGAAVINAIHNATAFGFAISPPRRTSS